MKSFIFLIFFSFIFSAQSFAQKSEVAGSDCSDCLFSNELIGFLKVRDIEGESNQKEHEDEIEIYGMNWSSFMIARAGSGRTRSRANVNPITFGKYIDKSTPYLILAHLQGKRFDEVVLVLRKDSGEAHLDYLTITMTNVVISSFEQFIENEPREQFSLSFEKIKIKYVEPGRNGSGGDEHEIEYDIAAGA